MSQEKSRVMRYADLRRKIENMSYFSLGESVKSEFTPDNDSLSSTPSASQGSVVKHNTLTIPLDELLSETPGKSRRLSRAAANTQELKKIDEPVLNKSTKRHRYYYGERVGMGTPRKNKYGQWWIWVIVGIVCLGLVAGIIYLAIANS